MLSTVKIPQDVCWNLPPVSGQAVGYEFDARRSGGSIWRELGIAKRFERTGAIALESLLKIALVLDCLSDFDKVGEGAALPLATQSLDDILAQPKTRKKAQLSERIRLSNF